MEIFSGYIQPLTQWLNTHPHWAGIITFLISFSESLAIVGSIIPGSVTMTAIGILIGSGVIPAIPIFIWAILGAIAGDSASYYLGLYFHEQLADYWPFKKHPQLLIKGKAFFETHGGKSVFIGRFLGPLRSIIPVIAGMMDMPQSRFLTANITSAILWSFLYILPGVFLAAAASELSKESAIKLLLYTLILLALIWAITWLLKGLASFTRHYLNTHLEKFWRWMKKHPHLQSIAMTIAKPHAPDSYTQLGLSLFALLSTLLFILTSISVYHQGIVTSQNVLMFNLIQSIRSIHLDKYLLIVTFLANKFVVSTVIITLFIYFYIIKNKRAAFIWLSNGVIAAGLVFLVKCFVQSARPDAVMIVRASFSYPSGHTTFALAVYGYLIFLIAHHTEATIRRFIYIPSFILLGLIAFSRLYLGAHWLSDVIGGILLALTITSFHLVVYHAKYNQEINKTAVISLTFITLLISIVFLSKYSFNKQLYAYQPRYIHMTTSLHTWWQNLDKPLLPYYRMNRLGEPIEKLNIQWAAPLKQIKKQLQQAGWHEAPFFSFKETVNKLMSENKNKHTPLFPQLYNNQRPKLIMIKDINKHSPILMLSLWSSFVSFNNSRIPLWVGSLQYRKLYSYLGLPFKHHPPKFYKNVDLMKLLSPVLNNYQWKLLTIDTHNHKVLLIKDFGNQSSYSPHP